VTVARRTNLYVDGFNLYYGSLKGTPYKWLDLLALAKWLFPKERINRVRYFSAQVSGRQDPGAPARQESYLRALRTLPVVSVHLGTFLSNDKSMPLAPAPAPPARSEPGFVYLTPGGKKFAWVTKTEEKGSDVNLATQLLLDAFDHDFDLAVVISNDSDLAEPVRLVRERFAPVGVVCPHQKPTKRLTDVASWHIKLYKSYLARSQFPLNLTDGRGTFSKPPDWP
jgi:uncharacterized LabA/DUF88 family protein